MPPTKRALVVGVNYSGQSCALNGCAKDALALAAFLEERDYQVAKLIDSDIKSEKTEVSPTRSNILQKLLELILSDAEELFFSFAGHGSRKIDRDGEEDDGRDEVLCPVDYRKGVIRDDALRGVLQCMRRRQRLVCIFDCCHSGSGMDLKFELFDRGGSSFRFFPAEERECLATPGHCLLLSGCQDDQTSAEAAVPSDKGKGWDIRGALTVAAIQVMKERGPGIPCSTLLREVRSVLQKGSYTQVAQLSAGRSCAPKVKFL